MAFDAHKNFAYSTVATAPSPASSGTSLILQAGDGAKFPTPPFNATVWPVGVNPLTTNAEIVRVTAISTDTLTITRAQESSSARSIVVGDQIAATITKKTITDIEDAAGSQVVNEVPGGSVNGSNTAFTTASSFASGSLRVHRNGIRLKGGGADFTENSGLNGFTMTTAPTTGDVLLCDYNITASTYVVGTNSFIWGETPSGSVNGSNAVFTAARAYIAGSVEVFIDGLRQKGGGTDYTETTPASGVITMTTAPVTGQTILINYQFNLNSASNADTVDGIHATTSATADQLVALNSNKRLPASGVEAPSADHLALIAGSSKLVKTTVLRQDNTTNSYQSGNTVILTGYGVITAGAVAVVTEAITFGVTFAQAPIVVATFGGDDTAGSSTYGQGGAERKNAAINAHTVTTTGFTARIYSIDGTSWTSGDTVFYQWIAIGELA